MAGDSTGAGKVRIDSWLWAARAFKTRSLAGKACAAGRVRINGVTVKPAGQVGAGDEVELATPRRTRTLTVKGVAKKRGPAKLAQELYEEEKEVEPPERDELGLKTLRPLARGPRPSTRDRRALRRIRGKS